MAVIHTRSRALALVPVALLSAAWTVGVAGADPIAAEPARAATNHAAPTRSVQQSPAAAMAAPASATDASAAVPGIHSVLAENAVAAIPDVAFAAYQRAATVIDEADPACHLGWELLAAIGEVESDHGRAGGARLDAAGVERPASYGPVLVGAGGPLPDTDGGLVDEDPAHDRGVGPFRFVPSTWSSLKVDANGDGVRDPQNIADAALAAAVHLCSGTEDLGTDAGRRTALSRYDHSAGYQARVLDVERGYSAASIYGTSALQPLAYAAPAVEASAPVRQVAVRKPTAMTGHAPRPPAATTTTKPTPVASPAPVAAPPSATPAADPVVALLTLTQATVVCTLDGLSSLLQPGAFQTCLAQRPHTDH